VAPGRLGQRNIWLKPMQFIGNRIEHNAQHDGATPQQIQ
jgi:hypothetical protein